MDHDAFLRERDRLRRSGAPVLDCAELNLYRSLGAELGPITPSTHRDAAYRCRVADAFLAFLGLPEALRARTQVSHGVRRSLGALFRRFAADGATVAIPEDVYPVYFQLAEAAGVRFVRWPSRAGLPSPTDDVDAILVCEPLKPWGRTLGPLDARFLAAWTRSRAGRIVVVDGAYATPPSAAATFLLAENVAFLLLSLSKSWLLPDHVGLCIGPDRRWDGVREAFAALPKDETKLRIGYAALTEHASRPSQVRRILGERAGLLDAALDARPELRASRCSGYFATSSRSFEELLEMGVLGIPSSVFGSTTTETVLSSLPPTVEHPASTARSPEAE